MHIIFICLLSYMYELNVFTLRLYITTFKNAYVTAICFSFGLKFVWNENIYKPVLPISLNSWWAGDFFAPCFCHICCFLPLPSLSILETISPYSNVKLFHWNGIILKISHYNFWLISLYLQGWHIYIATGGVATMYLACYCLKFPYVNFFFCFQSLYQTAQFIEKKCPNK